MRLLLFAAVALVTLPVVAQEAPTPDDALLELMLRQLGAEAAGDPLALPGEPQTAARAEGAPEERAAGLRESFAAAGIEGAKLTNVSCEGPRCTVELALALQETAALKTDLLAVEDWIAGSSTCPYAIATDLGETPRVRAAINCES